MVDLEMITELYASALKRVESTREHLGHPMTLTEKILYSHLHKDTPIKSYKRGEDYVNFSPDRVAMQDATAQMALLQFMNAGRNKTAVPTSVHCDHLIEADNGVKKDLATANENNSEVYDFLRSVSNKYSLGFWSPGAGIIHQEILENYAFPGGMMVGTDSHTPNAGGLGMIAIGVGGADAVDVMAGMPWELKMPKIIGVKLTGELNGWATPKDVILKLTGILTVKGGTNAVIEYFGEGTKSISATGKATICNMGAEVGATTSIFPFDNNIISYLEATDRDEVAFLASRVKECFVADVEVEVEPEKYYDRVVEINLSTLEPHINGPFTPDAANQISEFGKRVVEMKYPRKMEVGLIGSCTNSSYQDLCRAASIAKQAIDMGITPKAELIINPGSMVVYETAKRDGIIDIFESLGGVIMTNACGPCIGQWRRHTDDNNRPNSIVTSFNRNFAKRADGNPNTHAFVTSPEMVMALTIAGDLCFNPITDRLKNDKGEDVMLSAPTGDALPKLGFSAEYNGYINPISDGSSVKINIASDSKRLQLLEPFAPLNVDDFKDMALLIKTEGKCTTDHISMAGPWLKFRGHLDNISDNLLMGAVNSFNGNTNAVLCRINSEYDGVSSVARTYKKSGISSIVVAEDNYGEGSSREHAAMEPRFLNVKVIVAKSFARIHETNLKKQGVLAATFVNKEDYDRVREDDTFSIMGINDISVGESVNMSINHSDGSSEIIELQHTYNELQINWFKAGSALNFKG